MSIVILEETLSSSDDILTTPFLIITIREDFYLRSRMRIKGPPYIYVMDSHMCLNGHPQPLQLALKIKDNLVKDNSLFTAETITLNCEQYLADAIAKILLTADAKYFASFFSGTDTCSYAAEHLANSLVPRLTPSALKGYYPTSPIEKFAFLTGYLPCLLKHKQTHRLCTLVEAFTSKKEYYIFYIRAPPFISLRERRFILDYADATLALLTSLTNLRVLAPRGIQENITLKEVKKFLLHTIITLVSKYPAQIGKYFPIKENPTPYEQILLNIRHTPCLAYKKYVTNGGRDTSLEEYSNLAYLDRNTYLENVDAIFLKLGIEPFHTLAQSLGRLHQTNLGYIVKLANLIRRRIIWRRGNNIRLIPHFLKQQVYWWFDPKTNFLPEGAAKFMLPRIKLELERYLNPSLTEIISQTYTRIDLSAILAPLSWTDQVVHKIQGWLQNNDEDYSDALLRFIRCVFLRHTKNSTILHNYTLWLNIIYGVVEEKDTPLYEKDRFAIRTNTMPSRGSLFQHSAKSAQRLLAYQYYHRPSEPSQHQ